MTKNNSSKSIIFRFVGLYISLVLIISSFLVGVIYGGTHKTVFDTEIEQEKNNSLKLGKVIHKDPEKSVLYTRDVDFDTFWEIWNYIQKNYITQPVEETRLFYGALAGMVASLNDPYSIYFNPQTALEFQQDLAGNFEGIGAEIGIKKDQLTIISPLPNTPAERAGLKAGDIIVAIDHIDTRGMSLDMAVSLIRGKKGTEVVLTILRNGAETTQDISVVRDEITVESVRWEIKEVTNDLAQNEKPLHLAYIKIIQFSDDTIPLFNKAVKEIIKQDIDGIILDLRGNPGGYLEAAIDIASQWIEDGSVVKEEFSNGKSDQYYEARGRALLKDFKTVVLINNGSASGSEIVAGALQDYGLAVIVGERSFGKGSVQELESFSDGSAVKLTVANWLTPKGRRIEDEGIKPDIEVALTDEDYDNDRDPQLDKAVELFFNNLE